MSTFAPALPPVGNILPRSLGAKFFIVVLLAFFMSIPGIFVQAALNEHSTFALNPDVAETLHARVLQ